MLLKQQGFGVEKVPGLTTTQTDGHNARPIFPQGAAAAASRASPVQKDFGSAYQDDAVTEI